MQADKHAALVADARSLREALGALRRHMESVALHSQPGGGILTLRSPSIDPRSIPFLENKGLPTAPPESPGSVRSQGGETNFRTVKRGLSAVREASVAIFGGMNDGRGLSAADTLARCGVRKLILFDVEDSVQPVELARQRWDLEESPLLEIEEYVSEYTLDEQSFDHLLDRLVNGGVGELSKVSLLVLAPVEANEVQDLVHRAAREAGVQLLKLGDGMVATVVEPNGNEAVFDIEGLTLGSAALEVLTGN